MCLLVKCLFRSSAHFLIGLFVLLLLLNRVHYLYILEINPITIILLANIFSQSIVCLFVYGFLCCSQMWKFDSVLFVYFCFYFFLPWVTDLRKYWYDLCQRMSCIFSLLGVLWCHDISLWATLSFFLYTVWRSILT